MRALVILFAKAPVPGRVKTRLVGRLGEQAAAALHHAFVLDTLHILTGLEDKAEVELHTDQATDAWPGLGLVLKLQSAGDLGQRMTAALECGLKGRRTRVAIVGSDAPDLPPGHLLDLLDRESDVALGPAEDGGYWGISCRRAHADMFQGVTWSSADTLDGTERACRACGLSVERGRIWRDVDDFAGLQRLVRRAELPSYTREWVALQGRLLQ